MSEIISEMRENSFWNVDLVEMLQDQCCAFHYCYWSSRKHGEIIFGFTGVFEYQVCSQYVIYRVAAQWNAYSSHVYCLVGVFI